jgi:hypothetical protein
LRVAFELRAFCVHPPFDSVLNKFSRISQRQLLLDVSTAADGKEAANNCGSSLGIQTSRKKYYLPS